MVSPEGHGDEPSCLAVATVPAKQFISQRGIEEAFTDSIGIAKSAFRSVNFLSIALDEGEESGKQSIVIEIKIQSTLEKALTDYETFIQSWLASPAWHAREHICLSYRIG